MNVQQVYELGGFKGHGFEQQGIFQEPGPKIFDLHEYSWMGRLRLGFDTSLVHDTDAV